MNLEKLPKFTTFVKALYMSFDTSRDFHFTAYKINFYPNYQRYIPEMTELKDLIIDIHETSHSALEHMTRAGLVYLTSLTILCLVSMEIEIFKVKYITEYINL
jgi:hypothetical protein